MVILQILTGCGKKVDVSKKQQKITDTDGKDVSKDIIEKIKNNYADKNIEDLIFIPIKPGQCVIWNNKMYKHLVFANKTRLMMGPMDYNFNEVGFILRGGADAWFRSPRDWSYTENKSYTVPIRYATKCHTGMHNDTYPESNRQNDISIVVYLNDADGYFILQADNKSVQDNFKVIDLSTDHKDYITQLYKELNTDIKKYVDVDDDACVASDYEVEIDYWPVDGDNWTRIEDNNTESIIKVTEENKRWDDKTITIKSEWEPRPGNNWVILKKIESDFISSLYKNIGNYLEKFGMEYSLQWNTRIDLESPQD
tara:strand:- start:1829 stop:2761 length:933 start_codon:yes stop_codon:yes gene_type:complete